MWFSGAFDGEIMELRTSEVEREGQTIVNRMVFRHIRETLLRWDWQGSRTGGDGMDRPMDNVLRPAHMSATSHNHESQTLGTAQQEPKRQVFVGRRPQQALEINRVGVDPHRGTLIPPTANENPQFPSGLTQLPLEQPTFAIVNVERAEHEDLLDRRQ